MVPGGSWNKKFNNSLLPLADQTSSVCGLNLLLSKTKVGKRVGDRQASRRQASESERAWSHHRLRQTGTDRDREEKMLSGAEAEETETDERETRRQRQTRERQRRRCIVASAASKQEYLLLLKQEYLLLLGRYEPVARAHARFLAHTHVHTHTHTWHNQYALSHSPCSFIKTWSIRVQYSPSSLISVNF